MLDHPQAAAQFNRDESRVNWHDAALWFFRQKRDLVVQQVQGWEALRQLAADIKAHTLSRMDDYLLTFEKNALRNGVHVHWAKDADAHNQIVAQILASHNAKLVVKSKSMLTEECGLNPFLETRGFEIVDTDLGERIVQLAKEPPSHIVAPAIHKKREEIDELFHEHLNTKRSGGDADYLTSEARKHLREKFLSADAALTGVNFGVAETGGVVVCTNEGNADMGVHSAPLHIACMGFEKLIPKMVHLGIFLRILARSSTGQPITVYSSHFTAPPQGKEMHIIIVDNGRSEQLAKPNFRSSLHCIRCGACLNTCPVYRRSGGHSYGATLSGPIGAILSPGKDLEKHASLPFASTLCGSCNDVCPVKIDIHEQLYKWRQIITKKTRVASLKKANISIAAVLMSNSAPFRTFGRMANFGFRKFRSLASLPLQIWTRGRELPQPPKSSFKDWYKANRSDTPMSGPSKRE